MSRNTDNATVAQLAERLEPFERVVLRMVAIHGIRLSAECEYAAAERLHDLGLVEVDDYPTPLGRDVAEHLVAPPVAARNNPTG